MTTIAFRDGVMAADRQSTGRGSIIGRKTKIEKIGSALVGATGDGIIWESFFQWVRGGCKGDCPPMSIKCIANDSDFSGTGIIITRQRGIVTFIEHGFQQEDIAEFHAFGCGADIARGAMFMGATPEQAIQAASAIDLYTGCGVDVIRFD